MNSGLTPWATLFRRAAAALVVSVVMVMGLGLIGGCSAVSGMGFGPPDPIVNPVEARIDAIAGRTLVVPVGLGPDFDPQVPVSVRVGESRQIRADLYRVTVTPEDPAGCWLPPPGLWEVTPAAATIDAPEPSPGALVSWMLVVPLPPGAAGHPLWINTRRAQVNWLIPLSGAGVVRSADENLMGPIMLRSGAPTPATERILDPERASPFRRWRYRLYCDGLSRAPDAVGERLRFSDPVLEALAVQGEDRWGYALRAVQQTDPELAMRLARRLAMVADFGGGVIAPAWPPSQGDLDSLLTDLLDPRFGPERRAARAAAWLDGQTPAAAWVLDDAGSQDAVSGDALTTVGLVNLGEKPVAAFAGTWAGGPSAEVAALPVGVVERVVLAASGSGRSGGETLDLRVGHWSAGVSALAGRIGAWPPGLPIGPLAPDYSIETWLGSGLPGTPAPTPDPRWDAAGLVYRKSGTGAALAGPGDWVLYLECLRPVNAEAGAPSREDTVRVWIGLSGRPRMVLRVGESGYAHLESMRGSEGRTTTAEGFGVSVVARPGKWVCQIPIPAVCFEADGTLRLGLERIDSRGRRSAFPRPMLPWQTEPGRVAIDTSTW